MENIPLDAMDPATQAMVEALQKLYEQGGWLAVVGAAIMFGVRIFRMIGGGDLWDSLKINSRRVIIFGSGVIGAIIVSVALGSPILLSIPGGIIAGLFAMLKHKLTEGIGRQVRLTGNPKIDASLRLAMGDEQKPAKAANTAKPMDGDSPTP